MCSSSCCVTILLKVINARKLVLSYCLELIYIDLIPFVLEYIRVIIVYIHIEKLQFISLVATRSVIVNILHHNSKTIA